MREGNKKRGGCSKKQSIKKWRYGYEEGKQ